MSQRNPAVSFPHRSYNPNLPPLKPKREISGWTWFLVILAAGMLVVAVVVATIVLGISLGEAWRGAVT